MRRLSKVFNHIFSKYLGNPIFYCALCISHRQKPKFVKNLENKLNISTKLKENYFYFMFRMIYLTNYYKKKYCANLFYFHTIVRFDITIYVIFNKKKKISYTKVRYLHTIKHLNLPTLSLNKI